MHNWALASLGVAAGPATFLVDTSVALVAQPIQNALRAFSAHTGAWTSRCRSGYRDTFRVSGNIALVAPTQNALRAQRDNWRGLGQLVVPVDTGDTSGYERCWWHSQLKTNCVPIVLSLELGRPSAVLWTPETRSR